MTEANDQGEAKKARVVLIEDEEDIKDLIIFSIENSQCAVMHFDNAEEAFVQIEKERPNLIIVDWMLPGMDGIDLTKHIRKIKSPQRTPIIMLTARDEEADRERAFEAGVDRYITKPFSPKQLRHEIDELLRDAPRC